MELNGSLNIDGSLVVDGSINSNTSLNVNGTPILPSYPMGTAIATYTVGTTPYAIAFDGTNIWVANQGSNNVTVLNAATGVPASFSPVAAGLNPFDIAFDGTNMWITNISSSNVTVINAATGTPTGFSPVAVGNQPTDLAFDGTNMWITNSDNVQSHVYVINASTGSPAVFSPITVGAYPEPIAFDGTNMWVGVQNSSPDPTMVKISTAGTILGTFNITYQGGSFYPSAMAFDGVNMWVTSYQSPAAIVVNSAGSTIAAYTTGHSNNQGIVFDGSSMWVSNTSTNHVTQLDALGNVVGYFPVGATPLGSAFDGANVWVANSGSSSISKLADRPFYGPVTRLDTFALLSKAIVVSTPNNFTVGGALLTSAIGESVVGNALSITTASVLQPIPGNTGNITIEPGATQDSAAVAGNVLISGGDAQTNGAAGGSVTIESGYAAGGTVPGASLVLSTTPGTFAAGSSATLSAGGDGFTGDTGAAITLNSGQNPGGGGSAIITGGNGNGRSGGNIHLIPGSGSLTGQVAIIDGTQGVGKVLTSDASGNASWQPASGGITPTVYNISSPASSQIILLNAGVIYDIRIILNMAGGADELAIRVNGDTGSNYFAEGGTYTASGTATVLTPANTSQIIVFPTNSTSGPVAATMTLSSGSAPGPSTVCILQWEGYVAPNGYWVSAGAIHNDGTVTNVTSITILTGDSSTFTGKIVVTPLG